MTNDEKVHLICEIAQYSYDNTDSFELDRYGADLAYLYAAIAADKQCEWEEDEPLVVLLQQQFPPAHAVWQFITLEAPEGPD